jgi:hypothetical protein
MKSLIRSVLTAFLVAASTLAFTIGVLGSVLPPFVGLPDLDRVQTLTWPVRPLLRIDSNQGAVTVRTGGHAHIAARVHIRGYRRGGTAPGDLDRYVAGLVQVRETARELRVITEPEERPDSLEVQVDLSLAVPPGTDIEVDSANGNVWVLGNCGKVKVQGRNTDIEIDQPRGTVLASSTNGRIRVVGATEDTRLETVNGNIYAHMQGGALNASTINGAIVARVLQPELRYCELTAQNGGITLVLSRTCSAFIAAKTDRGVVQCDVPLDTSHGVRRRKHIEGNIGSGRMYISMDTLNGNVRIARSQP